MIPGWADPSSPWRTTLEVAAYLRFFRPDGQPDRKEAIRFMAAQGVRPCKRGRTVLYRREDVEGTLAVRPVFRVLSRRSA